MMRGVLADRNNEGHVAAVMNRLQSNPWDGIWNDLNLSLVTFEDLGLTPEAPDSLVWQTCQAHEVVLITINRNARGPDSLEATIRNQNTSTNLPVMTLANADRLLHDSAYLERVVVRLLDYLIDIDNSAAPAGSTCRDCSCQSGLASTPALPAS